MAARPKITIVGAGNLGRTLALSLWRAGFSIAEVVTRPGSASLKAGRVLARKLGARAVSYSQVTMAADVVWLCVPDRQIAPAAKAIAETGSWKERVVLHSSGALTSNEMDVLRKRGAAIASVHPLMTFVRGTRATETLLTGVPFAIEGDDAAVRVARRMVKQLGGTAYSIRKEDKAAYHVWGTFASPLLTALLAAAEKVAASAGVRPAEARKRMLPILQQTLAHYATFGAAGAFSGPLVRGDAAIVKKHLQVLRKNPPVRDVYLALARAGLAYLPVKNRRLLQKMLR